MDDEKNMKKSDNIKENEDIKLTEELKDDQNVKGDNFLLGKKTNRDNNEENLEKEEKMEEKKNEEFEFGYSIILLDKGEEGLIEDYLKERESEKNLSDFYNYNLNEEKWQKILNHSILVHYERHLKEEMEKRKKMQNFMQNINMNMNNSLFPHMNQMVYQYMNSNNIIKANNINEIKK